MIDVSPKPASPEDYLGDGVFASFDGYQIKLRTGDGNNQVIYLEQQVYEALIDFVHARGLYNCTGRER
jgi:hypothetical protein